MVPTRTITEHKGAVRGVCLSSGRLFSASEDNTAKIFDLNGSCLCTLRHASWVGCVLHVPPNSLYTAGDNYARLWDLASGQEKRCFAAKDWVLSLALMEGHLYGGCVTGEILQWRCGDQHLEAPTHMSRYPGHVYAKAQDFVIWIACRTTLVLDRSNRPHTTRTILTSMPVSDNYSQPTGEGGRRNSPPRALCRSVGTGSIRGCIWNPRICLGGWNNQPQPRP